MSEAATEQTETPAAEDSGISIPERPAGPPQAIKKTAVWPGPPDPETGERPHLVMDDEDEVPDEVAEELNLKPGARIRVTQRPLTHMEDARLLREALQREAGDGQPDEDTPLEPVTFLQVLIDRSVLDSNINIHKPRDKNTRRTHVRDMAVEDTFWWLYAWLGAGRIMQRLQRGQSLMDIKKKQRKSSKGKAGTR